MEYDLRKFEIAAIGLGYVGLPLATEFGKKTKITGFDIDRKRITELSSGVDRTGEISKDELNAANGLTFTSELNDIKSCNIFIITVPTPINEFNEPDLSAIISASNMIGGILKAGDLVIYESTVYPGLTEEICAPILSNISGLEYATENSDGNDDVFYLGYSPERINPGDKRHKFADIIKVTSGSTPQIAELVDQLYKLVVTAGTFKAQSIKVAEAAKVIENTQRDINIALVNELSILFQKLNIDTEAVLKAAATKWNFVPFQPGLVGGHCIGVDPYYLTHKAQQVGHAPELILAGRNINDKMAGYVVDRLVDLMAGRNISVSGSKILILGLTFKENCRDTRNSKVIDMSNLISELGAQVDLYDPVVDRLDVHRNVSGNVIDFPVFRSYDCIVLAVPHSEFIQLGSSEIRKFGKKNLMWLEYWI